jgi:hypothetical protein
MKTTRDNVKNAVSNMLGKIGIDNPEGLWAEDFTNAVFEALQITSSHRQRVKHVLIDCMFESYKKEGLCVDTLNADMANLTDDIFDTLGVSDADRCGRDEFTVKAIGGKY